MLAIKWFCALFFMGFSKTVHCSYRRIKDGKMVDTSVEYIVYLTKAEQSETQYDAWICGGAIVSNSFIVTSAACVEDVQFMYAISGYSKYVNGADIDHNECTSASKKKVVFVCVPRKYDFDYDPVQKWAFIDIAAVKVESPYVFGGPIPPGCSWTVNRIDVNFDPIYQKPKTDAVVMGWGHTEKWRKPNDTTDYNQEDLQYSSILIMDKTECKNLYKKTPELLPIIDAYMICAMHEGNLDEYGKQIKKPDTFNADGCPVGYKRNKNNCEEPEKSYKGNDEAKSMPLRSKPKLQYETPDETSSDKVDNYQNHKSQSQLNNNHATPNPSRHQDQQNNLKNNKPYKTNSHAGENIKKSSSNYKKATKNPYSSRPNLQKTTESNTVKTNSVEYNDDSISFEDIIMDLRRVNRNESSRPRFTRKAGICQNDHGGPLITWVGREAKLIGVASVFRLDKASSCIGPYLFTSTQCNGAFIDCVVNEYDPLTPVTDDSSEDEDVEVPVEAGFPTTIMTTSTRRKRTRKPSRYITDLPDGIDTGEDFAGLRSRQRKAICKQSPKKRGFHIVKRHISWKHHPDGPAQNELADK